MLRFNLSFKAQVYFILALIMLALFLGATPGSVSAISVGFALAGLTGRDVHIDVPLGNMAVQAFDGGSFVGQELFPVVPVEKQSNKYYTITKGTWLRLPDTDVRGPKQAPRRIEFDVSSDSYYATNYALAVEEPFENLANQDRAIMIRSRNAALVSETLGRMREQRIASKVTSISNIGSGVALTGANKWSNLTGSDPVADVTSGRAFIRSITGILPNVAVIDWDTIQILKRHPVILDMFKYTSGGMATEDQLRSVFQVERFLIPNAIKNAAKEGGTSSMVNIWGNICLLAYVDGSAVTEKTRTFGLGYRWIDPQLGVPFAVRVYDDPDPGKKIEIQEASYYQDEKIVAKDLSYLINNTL